MLTYCYKNTWKSHHEGKLWNGTKLELASIRPDRD